MILFSLTWGHTGVKVSNDISSESAHQVDSLPKHHAYSQEGSTKVVQRIVRFLPILFFVFVDMVIIWK